ncbi:unnamed protein product [Prorocentrum cordatum]|uniref:Transmembrane protein n=1 Tax=Prorocentrum cordatum TaxID=2364126 RepID=A0ABN9VDK9_9DINO|nr:unnamed protein product [Polarella glacialis]|mmetsp:Transcript_112240/g.301305  ORF Transcript_112240/g.301305 Transcript_112240/m.301305 type:complete len:145 (-) Transcript_112240:70-504(-)
MRSRSNAASVISSLGSLCFVAMSRSCVAGDVESKGTHSPDKERTQRLHADSAGTGKDGAKTPPKKAAADDDDIDNGAPGRLPPKGSEHGYIYVAMTVLGTCFSLAAVLGWFDDVFPEQGGTRSEKRAEKKEKKEKKDKKSRKAD